MHLAADGGREGLVGDPLLYGLLSETDRVDDAFHLAQLLLAQVHLLSSHVLVVGVVALGILSHLLSGAIHLLLLSPSILPDDVTILFGKLSAEVVNEVSLLVGENDAWILLRHHAFVDLAFGGGLRHLLACLRIELVRIDRRRARTVAELALAPCRLSDDFEAAWHL